MSELTPGSSGGLTGLRANAPIQPKPGMTGLRKNAPKCTQNCAKKDQPDDSLGQALGIGLGTACTGVAVAATAPIDGVPVVGVPTAGMMIYGAGQSCYNIGYAIGTTGQNPLEGVDW